MLQFDSRISELTVRYHLSESDLSNYLKSIQKSCMCLSEVLSELTEDMNNKQIVLLSSYLTRF